jgi:antimicrobial peptide system SdpA family protein
VDDAKALGRFTAVVGAVLALVVLYAVHASLPVNAVTLPFEQELAPRTWLPQGWGYFSGDARQERTSVYRRGADGVWRAVPAAHQGAPRHLFGLDRAGRVPELEQELLMRAAATEPAGCEGDDRACLDALGPPVRVANPAPAPTLCGDLALVRRPPLPWAWADHPTTHLPATTLHLEATC